MKKNSKYCSQFRTGDSKFIWFCSVLWLAEQIYLILFSPLIGWANLSDFVLPSYWLSKFIWFCSALWFAEQIYLILFNPLIGWANLSDFVLPSDWLSKFIWFCSTLWLAEQIDQNSDWLFIPGHRLVSGPEPRSSIALHYRLCHLFFYPCKKEKMRK